jgi:hypothetical protein
MTARWALAGVACSLVCGMTGCLSTSDSAPPELTLELYWDEKAGKGFDPAVSCDDGDVSTMEWELRDDTDTVVASSDDPEDKTIDDKCADTLQISDLHSPGNYELTITGTDATGQQHWSTVCTGIALRRFDAAYGCDIELE